MGREKGRFKHAFSRSSAGAKHIHVSQIKKPSYDFSNTGSDHFALDFVSLSFGRILVKDLAKGVNANLVQLFFKDFEEVDDVVITVNDIDQPVIDEKTRMVLEFENYQRNISARLFRALLPTTTKTPFMQYPSYYERLMKLLFAAGKGIELEGREV